MKSKYEYVHFKLEYTKNLLAVDRHWSSLTIMKTNLFTSYCQNVNCTLCVYISVFLMESAL